MGGLCCRDSETTNKQNSSKEKESEKVESVKATEKQSEKVDPQKNQTLERIKKVDNYIKESFDQLINEIQNMGDCEEAKKEIISHFNTMSLLIRGREYADSRKELGTGLVKMHIEFRQETLSKSIKNEKLFKDLSDQYIEIMNGEEFSQAVCKPDEHVNIRPDLLMKEVEAYANAVYEDAKENHHS